MVEGSGGLKNLLSSGSQLIAQHKFQGAGKHRLPAMFFIKTDLNGVVAQLAEHLLCKQGVTGSNPVGSTKATITARSLSFSNLGLIAQLVRARA